MAKVERTEIEKHASVRKANERPRSINVKITGQQK
jgi:hypothetical protein